MRIEICGGIATGKTTLASLLEKSGYSVVYEQPADNPFLKNFYSGNGRNNVFETEIVFTLMHYSQIVANMQSTVFQASDFSLFQDYCYGLNNLESEDLEQFLNIYRYLHRKIGQPGLLVFTKCSLSCQIARIRLRGRDVEQSISKDYVGAVNAMLENQILADVKQSSLFVVDTEESDLLSDAGQSVVDDIRRRLAQCEKSKEYECGTNRDYTSPILS